MKKIALVLAVLLVVSGAAFAEVDVYVGGQAQTSVKIDLDNSGYALANSLYAEVDLTFGEAVDRSGEGDVYGMISISNLALTQYYVIAGNDYATQAIPAPTADTGGHWSQDPVWTAKVVAGDFYVKIDGNERIRARRDVMANVLDDFSLIGLNQYGAFASASMAGTMAVGYSMEGLADLVVKVGTESATPVASNPFGLAVDASVTAVEDLNVDLSFVFANTATQVLGLGATVGYGVMVDTMTVTPYAGMDFDLTASTWEAGGGVKVGFDSDKSGVVNDAAGAWKGFFGSKTWVSAGADLSAKYTSAGVMDMAFTAAYLPVENLNSALLFEMTDVLGTSAMGLGAYADYTVSDVKLFGWVKYVDAINLLVGAEYKAIPNTTLGAKFTMDANTGSTNTSGDVELYCKVAAW